VPEDAGDYTVMSKKTGTRPPLKLEVLEPRLGDYNLTVLNSSGTSTGYTLSARLVVNGFEPPAESQEPDLAPTFDESDSAFSFLGSASTKKPTPDASAAAAAASSETATTPSLSSVSLDADPLLGSITEGDLEGALAAPMINLARTQQVAAKPKPPSGAVLLFWVVALPLAGVGGGAVVLVRRRRSAFTIA
jgi:hypothetical protein